ncbi:MAG: DNA-formamidopyrimidine glycosylase, partial [Erysipelotrichaceae bacterium]|nr:DNA-formamidopyrimidine glycosylase [Erysipelotrichaceae bacterium]
MPELPEVETVRRTLQYQLGHPLITKVEVYWERIVADMCKHDFCELIAHQ